MYIDHGNSAAVYRVQHPVHGTAALKIYDPTFFTGDNALIEAKRIALQDGLKNHGHPHLIEVLETGELAQDGTWFLLMEFCPWPSMEKVLAHVPDGQVHPLLRQLTDVVLFLDSKGYVHRDIKPPNITVSEDFQALKLLDLGVLRKITPDEGSGTDDRKFIATAQYSPPEFLAREEQPGAAGFAAINIYQVGGVLHDLIMKTPLFGEEAATKNKFILFKAVTSKMPRIANSNLPTRLLALCRHALDKDPDHRTKGVKLQDFLANADDSEALRRRIVQSRPRAAAAVPPSCTVWEPTVRGWIGTAARLERNALGASKISPRTTTTGGNALRWSVTFANAGSPLFVEVHSANSKLLVQVVSDTEPPVHSVVFEIGLDGPDLEAVKIPAALAAQYLYALDLALAGQKSAPLVHGGSRVNETWWVNVDQLDEKQREILIEPPESELLIVGPPGSGKTNIFNVAG